MKDLIRHGDLLFRPAVKDQHLALTKRKSKIVLEGEVTGHAHKLIDGDNAILDYYEKTWRNESPVLAKTFVEVTTPSTISHEEHGPLPVPPGFYEVIRAREFDYASNLARRVWD